MEVVFLLARLVSVERHREIVSQCVHDDDHSLVEALRVPAAVIHIARHKAILEINRWNGAFGAVLEDEAGQEEAGAEEVDSKRVEDAIPPVSLDMKWEATIQQDVRNQSEEADHEGMLGLELHRQPLVLGLEVLRWGIRARSIGHCVMETEFPS